LRLNVVALAHDWLSPLRTGDVGIPGLEVTFDHASPIESFVVDPEHDAGEMSLARMLLRWSRGDHRFVPVPLYVYRSFVHREYFVRSESPLSSLAELSGKRIALAGWPNTGNTWARAVLREAGVAPETVRWLAFREDDPDAVRLGVKAPDYVEVATERPLDLLLTDRVDAVIMGETPAEVRQPNGRLRRLYPDFPTQEKEYFARSGIYPGHHILGVRREIFEGDPSIVQRLYAGLEQARRLWFERRADLEETSPWLAADIDASVALFAGSWYQDGISSEANRRMIRALHEEQVAEGLNPSTFDPLSAFHEFEQGASAGVDR
jgi:4,5-dihydroxyphthalate decarboxylase